MEHPDVIREIDALIDSYNWEGVTDEPERIAISIKKSLRLNYLDVGLYWKHNERQMQFVIFQVFLQILRHPRVKHKEWILDVLSTASFISRPSRSDPFSRLTYRALQKATPVIQPYLRHHKAHCRSHAVAIVSRLIYQPDQAVRLLLDQLEREPSFENIRVIFFYLGELFLHSRPELIRHVTKRDVLLHLDKRLRSKSPVMRIGAGTLYIKIMKGQPPLHVLDIIATSWPALRDYKEKHSYIWQNLLYSLYLLNEPKHRYLSIGLLLNTQQFIIALETWEYIQNDYFSGSQSKRSIAFTMEQKQILEALVECKALWRKRRTFGPRWGYRPYDFRPEYHSLETTRAAFRQQLKHARIIAENEQFAQPIARFGLTLMQN